MTTETVSQLRKRALALHQAGKVADALPCYVQLLGRAPDDAQMWSNYGVLLRQMKQFANSERAHQRAYANNPASPVIRANYANILSDLGKYEESLALRYPLAEEKPDQPEQPSMIARCLRSMGRYREAVEYAETMITRFPDHFDLQMQSAMAGLALGEYQPAFARYRARWKTDEMAPRKIGFPEWQGEPLAGKTVVVLPEQGFGDYVLMSRFFRHLKSLGPARVIALVEKPLGRLMQDIDGADEVVTSFVRTGAEDYWINIMDLGALALQSDADIPVPANLHIPEDSVTRAREIVAPHAGQFKVGIVWTGSVTYKGNAFRSFSHTEFLPMTGIDGVRLFSLYKGPMLDAFYADGSAGLIVDAGSTDRDFADCAALMREMDLVITSDTATAHIAGSLGVPTWVALHMDAFWVYRHTGRTTPWYPSMTLFRQEQALDWADVMTELKTALEHRIANGF